MESNWELQHVGMVVRDVEKILDYYQSLGIGVSVGPEVLLPSPPEPGTERRQGTALIYGKVVDIDFSAAIDKENLGILQIGSLQLECIKPAVWIMSRDFLGKYGEGINHICFNVRDIQGKTAELVEKGCEITFSVGTEDSIGENYIDTSKFGNV